MQTFIHEQIDMCPYMFIYEYVYDYLSIFTFIMSENIIYIHIQYFECTLRSIQP
jgi:hypothetical protein